ncbi:MAG: DNA methyltransferase [Alphaproteobacteria bacterium HGW-Alphaproteobacteria-14]|nr:MAG: DNA methyltransferase [Alphaproteobacteria bacterium HGW-Alphaproteobacteria-14]
MSRQHINTYRRTLAEQHRVTGSLNERVLRKAFAELLERTGRAHDLVFTNEWEGRGPRGNNIAVDGALIPQILRKPFGYWEAKDSKDDLDREIRDKIAKGYPDDNIIYEDTQSAVLRQDGREVMRISLSDDDALLRLIETFFAHEPPELSEFKAASAKFRADLPQVLEALEMAMGEAEARSTDFVRALDTFLEHAKQAINPAVTRDDVRKMLIQHILTEEIFTSVFDNSQYHRENNIAIKLGELEAKFFTGALRRATVDLLRPYYGAIRGAAAGLADPRAKQDFVKRLYEDFYKTYDPNAADRLGVVYTPGEIVRFMIRGAEWLTEKHFGKTLADEGVEILDPATGTGTFIVELLEHMQGAGKARLKAKYQNELHANEVAILPYYVANLNIENTFAVLNDGYEEFPGLVFVDTLDNTAGLAIYSGHQPDMFGGTSDENLERVKRQNSAKIKLIIGNPPYNAWQQDYNARNPNRPYRRVDERIGQTYRHRSNAQNTNSLSDMYVRFWRWASDRLTEDGVIAMVTNRNFIEKVAFDGFRKSIAEEFAECWLMDLGGDVRANPKLSGTKHNVFGIQTGVTVAFMVRRKAAKGFKLFYARRPEDETAAEKLAFLEGVEDFDRWQVEPMTPDEKGNWLSGEGKKWSSYLPLADPTKGPLDRDGAKVEAIFRLSSNGITTQRDEWVWSRDRNELSKKAKSLVAGYEAARLGKPTHPIKWDADLDSSRDQGVEKKFSASQIIGASRRPFIHEFLYFDQHFVARRYRTPSMFRSGEMNPTISFRGVASEDQFTSFSTTEVFDAGLVKTGNGRTFGVTRYRYIPSGERVDNITPWALDQFRARYPDDAVTHDTIFAYCYAVLHDPLYREHHADDLRREFPRVPLYPDFAQWVAWGEALLKLHIGYEKVKPWPITRVEADKEPKPGAMARPILRPVADAGEVIVDAQTKLTGIPQGAWDYRLGNRSAIDWVLDQHKEKKIKDPTVREKFNTYRFADYKESMITLLAKVVRVSVETNAITDAMRALDRGEGEGA